MADPEVPGGPVRAGELKAFLDAASVAGFGRDQFVITAYDSAAVSLRQPGRVVSVHRGAFGRDFETFPGVGWVASAMEALRQGHFGRP